MKISYFVHDLALNPIGRAAPIIAALTRLGHECEVLGFLIAGDRVYAPYQGICPMVTRPSSGTIVDIVRKSRALADAATGDLVFAGKALASSFLPALMATRGGRSKPLILDVEDDDVWSGQSTTRASWLKTCLRPSRRCTAPAFGVVLHPLRRRCAHILVSTTALQRRYGGTILRHGPDETVFDPSLPSLCQTSLRYHYGLPRDALVVLFAGTPHAHKGFDLVVDGVHRSDGQVHLLACGNQDHPAFISARAALGPLYHGLGMLPNTDMPKLLAVADVVPILQHNTPYAAAQLPAKLLEAMAMGRSIIASPVGDLPQLLGDHGHGPCGWITGGAYGTDFAAVLRHVQSLPREEKERHGKAARHFYLDHASVQSNAVRLDTILQQCVLAEETITIHSRERN